MNNDRRIAVQVLADLVKFYSTQRTVPNRVVLVMRDTVKSMGDTEERSVKKMHSYRENEATRRNYLNATACRDDLRAAQEALEEQELEEALVFLTRVATPPNTEPEPAPKGKRK